MLHTAPAAFLTRLAAHPFSADCVGARSRGVTLIGALVAAAVFAVISIAAYDAMYALITESRAYSDQIAISALADQYLEIARNMPYSEIGTLSGNPHGLLPDLPNEKVVTVNGTTYDLYYDVTYIDDPADGTIAAGTDSAPDDYKQVKLIVVANGKSTSFVTNVSPKGLEGLESGGALSIEVFDANGNPVPGATVHITNTSISPAIDLTRTTNSAGDWIEVGLPDSVSDYHITVTKSGYSTDQTYPSTAENPNPVKPDETIANGQVTKVSFAIDQLSSLTFDLTNAECAPLTGVGLNLIGSKLVGTSPDLLKFSADYSSDSSGDVTIPSIEWDNYKPTITSSSYMVYGSSPIQQIDVFPGTAQLSRLILGPSAANSALVVVKDASTGDAIENAQVELSSATAGYDATKYTEGSVWTQNDWSGGAGQADIGLANGYDATDGNIDTTTLPMGVRLHNGITGYPSSGWLESSTYDTGTASTTYTTLEWQPTSQTASTSLAFQIATNNDNATWNFLGPDGTPDTYYTVPGTTINATTSYQRYVRYKAYLASVSTTTTPVLSSVTVNYVSGCSAPGQAMFAPLTKESDYTLTVTMPGYQTNTQTATTISGRNTITVLLSPAS